MNVAILLFMITNLNCHHSRNPAMRPTSFRGIGNPPMKAAPAPAVPNQACTSFHNCKPRPIHWKIKAAICGKVQELAAKCRNLRQCAATCIITTYSKPSKASFQSWLGYHSLLNTSFCSCGVRSLGGNSMWFSLSLSRSVSVDMPSSCKPTTRGQAAPPRRLSGSACFRWLRGGVAGRKLSALARFGGWLAGCRWRRWRYLSWARR